MHRKFLLTAGLAAVLTVATVGFPRAAQEPVDTASVEKIKAIGLDPNSSKVMEIASYLTDVYGPRLTGSANIKKAGDWSVERMKEWGLTGAALEPWPADPSGQNGGFPCGWTNDKFYLAATLPQAFPIRGTPSAWSPGTNGLVRGEVVLVTETTEEALKAKYKPGDLKGKWVISAPAPTVNAYFNAPATRQTQESLDRMENPPPPDPNAPARGGGGGRNQAAGAPPRPHLVVRLVRLPQHRRPRRRQRRQLPRSRSSEKMCAPASRPILNGARRKTHDWRLPRPLRQRIPTLLQAEAVAIAAAAPAVPAAGSTAPRISRRRASSERSQRLRMAMASTPSVAPHGTAIQRRCCRRSRSRRKSTAVSIAW